MSTVFLSHVESNRAENAAVGASSAGNDGDGFSVYFAAVLIECFVLQVQIHVD